jgi:hypothetical protein
MSIEKCVLVIARDRNHELLAEREELGRIGRVLPDGVEPLAPEVARRAEIDDVARDELNRDAELLHAQVHQLPCRLEVARVAEDADRDGAGVGDGRERLRGAPHLLARRAAADLVVVRRAGLQAADVDRVGVGRGGSEVLRRDPAVARVDVGQRARVGADLHLGGVRRRRRLPHERDGRARVGVARLAAVDATADAHADALGRDVAGRRERVVERQRVVAVLVGEAARRRREAEIGRRHAVGAAGRRVDERRDRSIGPAVVAAVGIARRLSASAREGHQPNEHRGRQDRCRTQHGPNLAERSAVPATFT